MQQALEIFNFLNSNKELIAEIATGVVTICSALARILPDGAAHNTVDKIIKFINFLALNKPKA